MSLDDICLRSCSLTFGITWYEVMVMVVVYRRRKLNVCRRHGYTTHFINIMTIEYMLFNHGHGYTLPPEGERSSSERQGENGYNEVVRLIGGYEYERIND